MEKKLNGTTISYVFDETKWGRLNEIKKRDQWDEVDENELIKTIFGVIQYSNSMDYKDIRTTLKKRQICFYENKMNKRAIVRLTNRVYGTKFAQACDAYPKFAHYLCDIGLELFKKVKSFDEIIKELQQEMKRRAQEEENFKEWDVDTSEEE